jgi:hypothetical protein
LILNAAGGYAPHISSTAPANALTLFQWFIEALEILREHIRSKATGQLVGFEGAPTEGLRLKVGAPAEVWMTHRYGSGYKYDHPVLSSYPLMNRTSFDRIKLVDTPFVIEFPENNLDPGTFAQLGRDRENQIWYIKGESCP